MSDYKSVEQLSYENPNLNNHILSLKDVIDKLENDKIDLAKKLKELETKLAQAENSKQTAIDDLTTSYDVNQSQKNRIKDLEIVRDNLNRMIDFAVGYISATQPHTDKHPMEVKQWLFKGLE